MSKGETPEQARLWAKYKRAAMAEQQAIERRKVTWSAYVAEMRKKPKAELDKEARKT